MFRKSFCIYSYNIILLIINRMFSGAEHFCKSIRLINREIWAKEFSNQTRLTTFWYLSWRHLPKFTKLCVSQSSCSNWRLIFIAVSYCVAHHPYPNMPYMSRPNKDGKQCDMASKQKLQNLRDEKHKKCARAECAWLGYTLHAALLTYTTHWFSSTF